jgi:hypothetical protein
MTSVRLRGRYFSVQSSRNAPPAPGDAFDGFNTF